MKSIIFLTVKCILVIHFNTIFCQDVPTRLLVRIDDMGFSHAANLACIEAYKNGIARSVEVIVPGPWFEEAAKLLNDHPGLDAGVHLTLTSEWANLKWRPLTYSPSLTDADGYFFPMIWKNERFPEGSFLKESNWKLEEIEQELRAQIELAVKKIPQISHVTAHMGCSSISAEVKDLVKKLAQEYDLDIFPEELNVQRTPRWSGNKFSSKEKESNFIQMIHKLKPGDWLTVEHPGYDVEELRTVGHIGYENVAADRAGVTSVFTSKKVLKAIRRNRIVLISYRDL